MKRCPFCKADIEDNASFCLYCMKSLEEKQKVSGGIKVKNKVPLLLIIGLLLIFAAGALVFVQSCINNGKSKSDTTTDDVSISASGSESAESTAQSTGASESKVQKETKPAVNNPNGAGSANSSVNTAKPGSGRNPVVPQENPILPSEYDSTYPIEDPYVEPDITTIPVETPDYYWPVDTTFPLETNITYYYRQAQRGDDVNVNYPFTENDIVITGVGDLSRNGLYVIPPKIDGKRVIGISTSAFSDSSVCETVIGVVVPETVLTISSNAFYGCTNMTDIYFCGKNIFTDTNAFSTKRNGTLTIHCPYDCSDRNFRYYRKSASYYGALYEEWNYMGG